MCIGYPDDLMIGIRGGYQGMLYDLIKSARECRGGETGSDSGYIIINPAKSNLIYFSRGCTVSLRRISFLGEENKHVQVTLNKTTRALMVCRRLSGTH